MSQRSETLERLIELEGKRIILQRQVVDISIQINMLYVKLNKLLKENDNESK